MKTTAWAKATQAAIILLGAMFIAGCDGGPTGADAASERTENGIRVIGAGPDLYATIDQRWAEVESCWNGNDSGVKPTVTIVEPELYDQSGQGVIRVNGTLVYGMRSGDRVWVAPDLAALRHEFSHIVGQRVTGQAVDNNSGQCWL